MLKRKRGVRALITAAAIGAALGWIGGCKATTGQGAGAGAAPGASAESYGAFQPSDSPPKCVPIGTVAYETYDSAANMRYWVFRWPDGSYGVTPRVAAGPGGRIVAYQPPAFEPDDAAETSAGTVEVD